MGQIKMGLLKIKDRLRNKLINNAKELVNVTSQGNRLTVSGHSYVLINSSDLGVTRDLDAMGLMTQVKKGEDVR